MKTIQEIIDNWDDYITEIDDRFGRRFINFLTEEQANKIGWRAADGHEWREPKEWNRENILEQLKEDVAFGFEKALDRRGISASLMFDVVLKWSRILEEGHEDWDEGDYAQYGLPLFKATAEKYGFDNPIGEDSGRESEYAGEN